VHRGRRHGNSSRSVPASQLVVCSQNHDQVGNRLFGDRLSTLVDFEKLKLAAAAVILSPFVPLLFMGEEYGETCPFQYFTSHSDPALITAVARGRREEFAAFGWKREIPDPNAESTFLRCKLNRALMSEPRHRILYDFYRECIMLRKKMTVATLPEQAGPHAVRMEEQRSLLASRGATFMVLNFGDESACIEVPASFAGWRKLLDSADKRWLGPGSATAESVPKAESHREAEPGPPERQIVVSPNSLVLFTAKPFEKR
jgi:maltooligosyltrehalose trehalohydrolase